MNIIITSAGIGSRFVPFSNFANKGLAPFPYKPILSLLLETFSSDNSFHIVTGHHGDDLEHTIQLLHPLLDISFYRNDDYLNSGMGDSLLSVLSNVDGPCIVLPNDGIYKDLDLSHILSSSQDIILGYSTDPKYSKTDYLCLSVDNDSKLKSYTRGSYTFDNSLVHDKIFTGFLFIRDSSHFREILSSLPSQSKEIYDAFSYYISNGFNISATELPWTDLGTYSKYKFELNKLVDYDFSKQDETLLFSRSKVFKYFAQESVAVGRFSKATKYSRAFPTCTLSPSRCGYSYDFVAGNTLYQEPTLDNLSRLLDFLSDHLWDTSCNYPSILSDADSFYRTKTIQRLDMLRSRYSLLDIKAINSTPLQHSLIPDFDYAQFVDNAIPSPIHGDLQYDNVVLTHDSNILLLDWRHCFGSSIYYGDIYYDFAKLLGGIYLNYSRIKKNQFSCSLDGSNLVYSYQPDDYLLGHVDLLFSRSSEFNLDTTHIKRLTSLIYANMSPLHAPPFDLLLLALSHQLYYDNLF